MLNGASAGRRRSRTTGARGAGDPQQGRLWDAPRAASAAEQRRPRSGLLKDAFDQAQDALIIFDRQGRIRHLNQAARRLGLREDGPFHRMPAAGLEGLLKVLVQRALRGEAASGTPAGEAAGGRDGPALLLSCTPVRGPGGGIAGVVCTLSPQRAPAANDGLRGEVRRLVHDYNNTLTVLLASLSMAAEEVTGPAGELLGAAQEAAQQVRRLTQELPGRLQAATRGDAREAAIWPIAGWEMTPAARAAIAGLDPVLLWRLALHLGHVALRALMEAGPVQVQADVGQDGPCTLTAAVLWQGGWDVGGPRAARLAGRLQRLVAARGGTCSIAAQAEGGALRVSLPLEPVAPPRERARILLMDDERAVREIAARILGAAHYDVSQAADGRAALALFRRARSARRPFQLAVLDLTVPGGMDGLEAGRRLRELDPELPILLSSARVQELQPQEWRRMGFCGVVPKPYTANELRSGVQRALRGEDGRPA